MALGKGKGGRGRRAKDWNTLGVPGLRQVIGRNALGFPGWCPKQIDEGWRATAAPGGGHPHSSQGGKHTPAMQSSTKSPLRFDLPESGQGLRFLQVMRNFFSTPYSAPGSWTGSGRPRAREPGRESVSVWDPCRCCAAGPFKLGLSFGHEKRKCFPQLFQDFLWF